MSYYSFEKGKYGGPCGSIFPFFRTITGISALGEDYAEYIPAGYLKCRGQILSANDYPNLARLLGVGSISIYKKENSFLQEAGPDGRGGTFQLPDLGSKYITGSSNSGTYLNTTTTNPATNSIIDRAGVEVEISAQSSSVDFSYTGSFRVPGRPIQLTGQMNISSPPTSTESSTVSIGQTLAHGHNASFKIARRINYRNDAMAFATTIRNRNTYGYLCNRLNTRVCVGNDNFGMAHKVVAATEEGTDSGTNHRHFGTFPVKNSETKTASTRDLLISAAPITTTVNINTANTVKMDDIAPKFILCEYLIKY
jgi:microcystin-dependent protein